MASKIEKAEWRADCLKVRMDALKADSARADASGTVEAVKREYAQYFMGGQRPNAAWLNEAFYRNSSELRDLKKQGEDLRRKAAVMQHQPSDASLPAVVQLKRQAEEVDKEVKQMLAQFRKEFGR